MMKKPHKKLDVWKKAVDFSVIIYRLTGTFPTRELYGLVAQMRRAVVSISCNVAEGAARRTKKEFIHFLYVARGSLSELDTQIEISIRLGYLASNHVTEAMEVATSIDMMLSGLIKALKRNEREPVPVNR